LICKPHGKNITLLSTQIPFKKKNIIKGTEWNGHKKNKINKGTKEEIKGKQMREIIKDKTRLIK
jgi:hypothetical protein